MSNYGILEGIYRKTGKMKGEGRRETRTRGKEKEGETGRGTLSKEILCEKSTNIGR